MKVNINGLGHVSKMAAMAINSNFQNRKTCDFETLPEASVNGALQSLYKSRPRDDLDLFYGKVSLGRISRSQVSVYRAIGPLVDSSGWLL